MNAAADSADNTMRPGTSPTPPPQVDPRFAVNGAVRLAYDDPGPINGDPLLMINGTGVSRFWWPQGLLKCLQEHGFRPAVFDLRDAGQSTHMQQTSAAGPHRAMLRRRPAAYGAEDLVDDAAAVLDALDWPAAHVFGLSLGGVIAQRLALRHPPPRADCHLVRLRPQRRHE